MEQILVTMESPRLSVNKDAVVMEHPQGIQVQAADGSWSKARYVNVTAPNEDGRNPEGRPYVVLVIKQTTAEREHTEVVNYSGNFGVTPTGAIDKSVIRWGRTAPADFQELVQKGIRNVEYINTLCATVDKNDWSDFDGLSWMKAQKELASIGIKPVRLGRFLSIPNVELEILEGLNILPYKIKRPDGTMSAELTSMTTFVFESDLASKDLIRITNPFVDRQDTNIVIVNDKKATVNSTAALLDRRKNNRGDVAPQDNQNGNGMNTSGLTGKEGAQQEKQMSPAATALDNELVDLNKELAQLRDVDSPTQAQLERIAELEPIIAQKTSELEALVTL